MGAWVSRHRRHNRRGVNDAPYHLAEPDPVEEHEDNGVEQEQLTEDVTRDSAHINSSDASDMPPIVNTNSDQADETSGAIAASSSTTEDQNEASGSQIDERREHKPSPSSPPVAIAISPKPGPSKALPSTGLHEVRTIATISIT